MDLDDEGYTKIRFTDNNGNENPLFIRLFENGRQIYDQTRKFPVKTIAIFSFPGKDGKIIEKRREIVDEDRSETLASLVVCLHAYMRMEGNTEISEALEIVQTPKITYIYARKIPYNFTILTGCVTMSFNN